MTIPLNGVNHVSEQRRQAYQEALENGYRVEGAAGAPAIGTEPAAPQQE
ncbi:hypothetical protein LUW77_28295 [Streptomyces radiopugnans]|nr:hypothetical protein LUW77_28295 [Streptomyces radiopugnans]